MNKEKYNNLSKLSDVHQLMMDAVEYYELEPSCKIDNYIFDVFDSKTNTYTSDISGFSSLFYFVSRPVHRDFRYPRSSGKARNLIIETFGINFQYMLELEAVIEGLQQGFSGHERGHPRHQEHSRVLGDSVAALFESKVNIPHYTEDPKGWRKAHAKVYSELLEQGR